MTALERLKAKIDEWKSNYETIAKENQELKAKLENSSNGDCSEVIANLEAEINNLKQEIEEKDVEIESILESVEELLN
jgi:archaellum component FlaC